MDLHDSLGGKLACSAPFRDACDRIFGLSAVRCRALRHVPVRALAAGTPQRHPHLLSACTPGCLYAWMLVRLDAYTPGCLYAWMLIRLDAYTPGCLYAWMLIRLDAYTPGCLYA